MTSLVVLFHKDYIFLSVGEVMHPMACVVILFLTPFLSVYSHNIPEPDVERPQNDQPPPHDDFLLYWAVQLNGDIYDRVLSMDKHHNPIMVDINARNKKGNRDPLLKM